MSAPASAQNESATGISAAIITYNEEARIADCIGSVHDWCDEVLVLDSHSTDKTKSIATGFPKVRFLTHDFDGHIEQKNRALESARGPWVFCLDADETVTPELAASLTRFVSDYPQAAGARVRRLTYHLGRFIRHGGWYNTRYRLVRKGMGSWGGENPHDMIILHGVPMWKQNTAPILKGDLLHYSFIDLSHQVDTINKFSSIVAFTRKERGARFSLWKLLFKPWGKFVEVYLLKRGFLDGMPGLIGAINTSYAAFLRFAKLYELTRTKVRRPSNLRADYQVQGAVPKEIRSLDS